MLTTIFIFIIAFIVVPTLSVFLTMACVPLRPKLTIADVTRVEIIDDQGRAYVNRFCKNVRVSSQDQGRTLKIFLDNKNEI